MAKAMKTESVVSYLFLSIIWGLSFLVVLKVVNGFGWVGAVSFRALVAGTTLLVVAAVKRRKIDVRTQWRSFAVVGATTVAGQLIGLSFATPRIGTAMAAILVATIPLFSMIIGQVWGLERVTPQRFAGLMLGAAGIVLLVGFPVVPVTRSFVLGCASSLFGSFCAALGSNYTLRRLRNVGALEVTASAFVFGGLITLPLLAFVPVASAPTVSDFAYLAVLGSLMSGFAYVTYFRLVSSIGATRAISVEFVVTVVAVCVGALMLGESLSAIQLTGAVIVAGGCALVLGITPDFLPGQARRRYRASQRK
ncbi:DMT family transporter [Burkholderia singularis]|nr:EamA family transporter [Burkholderia singularis]